MCPPCIESRDQIIVFIISDRKLRFVPIVPRLFHADDRFHDPVDPFGHKSADADQIVSDLVLFENKLPFIAHCLNLAAAALSVKGA